MTGVAAIQSRMAEIQERILSFTGARPASGSTTAAAGSTASSATSAAATSDSFASSLQTALTTAGLGTTAGTGAASGLGATAGTTATAATAAATTSGPATPGTGAALVEAAKKYLGVPYVWGGESTSGMDCSGLVQRAFADLGVTVPRTAREQMRIGTAVASLAQARPGDLIVQRGGGHIGIYVGNGQMLHAPQPGEQVKIGPIYSTPTAIRRVLPTGESAAVDQTAVTSGTVTAAELARLALGLSTSGSTT